MFHLLNNKRQINQKLNYENFSMNTNINTNINLTGPNEISNYRANNHNSHDDYFVHSHSVKRIYPIIVIDPNNL